MRTDMKIGVAIALIGALVAVGMVVVARRIANQTAATEAQRQTEEANVKRLLAIGDAIIQDQKAQRARLTSATFRSSRTAVIDGQPLGKGKPSLGYTIEGSTYADNVVVGAAAGCEAFGSDENNITNFFCCKRALPATLQIAVDSPKPNP